MLWMHVENRRALLGVDHLTGSLRAGKAERPAFDPHLSVQVVFHCSPSVYCDVCVCASCLSSTSAAFVAQLSPKPVVAWDFSNWCWIWLMFTDSVFNKTCSTYSSGLGMSSPGCKLQQIVVKEFAFAPHRSARRAASHCLLYR